MHPDVLQHENIKYSHINPNYSCEVDSANNIQMFAHANYIYISKLEVTSRGLKVQSLCMYITNLSLTCDSNICVFDSVYIHPL